MHYFNTSLEDECPTISPEDDYALGNTSFILEGKDILNFMAKSMKMTKLIICNISKQKSKDSYRH